MTPLGPDLWQNTIANIDDDSVDGILYDTYPLNKEEQHIHQFEFLKQARRILKPGGIMTYCNLTSTGVLKHDYDSWEQLFEETQKRHLINAGYTEDEILGVEDIGIHDNFFDLGGHSLLATKMIARISDKFDQTLRMRVIFDFPTISELAKQIFPEKPES